MHVPSDVVAGGIDQLELEMILEALPAHSKRKCVVFGKVQIHIVVNYRVTSSLELEIQAQGTAFESRVIRKRELHPICRMRGPLSCVFEAIDYFRIGAQGQAWNDDS